MTCWCDSRSCWSSKTREWSSCACEVYGRYKGRANRTTIKGTNYAHKMSTLQTHGDGNNYTRYNRKETVLMGRFRGGLRGPQPPLSSGMPLYM